MLIIVAGTLTVPPEQHEALKAAVTGLVGATRAEEGGLEFGFWADLGQPGRFHVYEVWATPEALAAHLTTPHLQAFRTALASLQVQASLRRYRAEEIPRA